MTNLGLISALTVQIRPTGGLHYGGATTVVVEQDIGGDIHSGIDSTDTPLGDALHRGRPTRQATTGFLQALPDPMVVSALIEFDRPLDAAAFHTFFDTNIPVFDVPNRGVPVFLANPYVSSSTNPISWPNSDFSELRSWAAELSADDDEQLARIGLPTAADIKQAASAGTVHAFVVPRMPLSLARALLGTPGVHSVNVLDAAFSQGLRT